MFAWPCLHGKLALSVIIMLSNEFSFHSYLDVDNEYRYIMRRALRSYEEHRQQEKRGGVGRGVSRVRGGATGPSLEPTERRSISQTLASRTVTIPDAGAPIMDTPRSCSPTPVHSPSFMLPCRTSNTTLNTTQLGNPNKATLNSMMSGRMLTNRPRAKSAFARTRENNSQVLTMGLNENLRTKNSVAFAGPRLLGSTPAANPISPPASEYSFQTAPPHPSPTSSASEEAETEDSAFIEDAISNVDSVSVPPAPGVNEPVRDLIIPATICPAEDETIPRVKGGPVEEHQEDTCTTYQER